MDNSLTENVLKKINAMSESTLSHFTKLLKATIRGDLAGMRKAAAYMNGQDIDAILEVLCMMDESSGIKQ